MTPDPTSTVPCKACAFGISPMREFMDSMALMQKIRVTARMLEEKAFPVADFSILFPNQ